LHRKVGGFFSMKMIGIANGVLLFRRGSDFDIARPFHWF
jgi:hypothetical protein